MPEIIHTWFDSTTGSYVVVYDDGTREYIDNRF